MMRINTTDKRSTLPLGTLLCLFVMAADLTAQISLGTSSVGGNVRDPAGLVVPGVAVELTDLEHGVSRHTSTNETGNYFIPAVSAGFYSLTFSKQGFKTFTVSNFQVVVSQSATMNATLEIGTTTQSVTVSEKGAAQLLEHIQLAGERRGHEANRGTPPEWAGLPPSWGSSRPALTCRRVPRLASSVNMATRTGR